jgi:putative transposase
MAMTLIDEAVTAGARQRLACGVLGLSCRTLRRWQAAVDDLADKRRGASGCTNHALTEQEKLEIVEVCNKPQYQSLAPSQIVPMLADDGQYIGSVATFYRVLHDVNQANRRGKARPPRVVPKPKACTASRPNLLWSWDITFLPTFIRGEFLKLYMIVDIFSRLVVAWEIHEDELAEHASGLMEKACLKHGVNPNQLTLHSDNGSPMKGATMLVTLQRLGVMPSFSRPSVSDDNPFSESLFRTLKYCPTYPTKPFADIEQARQWVHTFVSWYNNEHRHSGIKFVTPAQRHYGKDQRILENRQSVYEAAKLVRPDRWRNRSTRNWDRIEKVWLNPPKEHVSGCEDLKRAA